MRVNVLQLLLKIVSSDLADFKKHIMSGDILSSGVFVSFVNPLSVAVGQENPDYLDDLSEMDYVFSDGILLCKALSSLSDTRVERFSFDGNSIAPLVFQQISDCGIASAFIGGRDGVARDAAAVVSEEYGVNVAFTRNGYFDSSEMADVLHELDKLSVKFVLLGMGAPYQESFLRFLKTQGWSGIAISCGGYLDQVVDSGVVYYPRLINALNLRAFYRVFKEPTRLVPRYTVGYFPFYLSWIKELFNFGK